MSDASGIRSLVVSIRNPSGRYWNGRAFVSTSREIYNAVGRRPRTVSWRYRLAFPGTSGAYTIHVRATDALGNTTAVRSPAATTFTIGSTPWRPPVIAGQLAFRISGAPRGRLYPGGAAEAIAVALRNPNDVPAYVTAVVVRVDSASLPSACSSASFELTQPNVSDVRAVRVPTDATVTLPAQGATTAVIRMVDTGTNQDACQGAVLRLAYTGSARP